MSSALIGLTLLTAFLLFEYFAWKTHWMLGVFITLLFAAVLTKGLGL